MTIWYIARGTGLSALVLLTIATAMGALMSRHGRPGRRYVVQYLHRVVAGLGLLVLGVHLGTVLADAYANVSLAGALVPFTAGYRAGWTGLGTIAVYLFLGVSLLGLARGRMAASPLGARVWRGLHALAYVGWVSAMFHGFFSGTDSSTGWVRLLYVACGAAVVASVVVRVAALPKAAPQDTRENAPVDRFAGRPAPAVLTGGAVR